MTELKTLTDVMNSMEYGSTRTEIADELRKQAIKWINEPYEYIGDGEYRFTNSGMRFRWEDWIKHFFNISEEELK